jgi:hypothetical protein
VGVGICRAATWASWVRGLVGLRFVEFSALLLLEHILRLAVNVSFFLGLVEETNSRPCVFGGLHYL